MELREVLRYQIETLEELNELMDHEREVLIKDRAIELHGILDRKKVISQKLSLLEKKRLELVGNSSANDLICRGHMDVDQLSSLMEIIESIKQKEETNLALTKQSINYIRLITSALNPKQNEVTYGSSGKVGESTATVLFTTKA